MIPFAALACLLETADGGAYEVSAADLSALGLTFRTPRAWTARVADLRRVTLTAHRLHGDETCTLEADEVHLSREEDAADCALWRLETENTACRALLRRTMEELRTFAALKQAGDDARLSETMTGYPAAAEGAISGTFASQRAAWLASCAPDSAWRAAAEKVPELVIALTEPSLWSRFLDMAPADFTAWYWAAHGLGGHPLAARWLTGVAIGSPFCGQLFPETPTLLRLLDRAAALGLCPVLCLAPVAEERLDETVQRLDSLVPWCRAHGPLEVEVNDWGLPALLRDRPHLTLTLGALLNKRRRDVRMPYAGSLHGREPLLRENAANAGFFRAWLKAQGFTRVVCEACGYAYALPEGPVTLRLPFFQMNTAARCTLAARCETGSRALQRPVSACPRWCERYALLYPDMLRMVGRYNTLFGLDLRSLTDGAYLQAMTAEHVDRLLIDLM